jgi:hypothetical protein
MSDILAFFGEAKFQEIFISFTAIELQALEETYLFVGAIQRPGRGK